MGFSFSDHIGLLGQFLAGRQQIVDDIDRRLLNVRGKATAQRTMWILRRDPHQLFLRVARSFD